MHTHSAVWAHHVDVIVPEYPVRCNAAHFGAQGEPLNNYAAVRAAVGMLTDGRIFGLRRQKVTVSTVGVVPRVLQVGAPKAESGSVERPET